MNELHPPLGSQAAVAEANRCLYCFDAPCAGACPTHIDVPKFIKKIASGNLMGSARSILDANALGFSCARVCPVEVLCEGACVLHNLHKEPIAIGLLQRHAMDHFYTRGGKLPVAATETGKRVACVGAGPASLACAAELRAHGVAVTIFDRHNFPGGLNTYGVAAYKFTAEESRREVELIRQTGTEFRSGVEIGADLPLATLEAEFHAIFLGVGLGGAQALNVPGEHLAGVYNALDFIAAYKTGLPRPMAASVVVIGGGNTAIDAAVAASLLGAAEVTILYRRSERDMTAFAFEYEHAKREGVRFAFHAVPKTFQGETAIAAVECEDGRRFPCGAAIVAIGQLRLLQAQQVEIDPQTGQTANPKYFAGGDCVNGGREVVDAVAAGKRAALGILQWLT